MKDKKTGKKIGLVLGTAAVIAAAVLAFVNFGGRKNAPVDEFAGDGYGEATTAAAELYEDVPEEDHQVTFLSSILKMKEEEAEELIAELSEMVPDKISGYEVEEYNDGGFAVRCITKSIGTKEYYLVELSDDHTPGEMTGPYNEDGTLVFPEGKGADEPEPKNDISVQIQPLEKESE